MFCTRGSLARVNRTIRSVFTAVVMAALLGTAAQAQTPTVLYNFAPNGPGPLGFLNPGTVSQGQDGAIYTTSVESPGLGYYSGMFFSMTTGGNLSQLFAFPSYIQGQPCPYGNSPYSGTSASPDGTYLVATLGCGLGWGTVLTMTPSGSANIVYSFTDGVEGGQPVAAPILGTDGNYYGVTECGGATPCGNTSQGCGTVYQLTPAGTLGWVHQFTGTDGCNGFAPLVQGKDGNLYGSTAGGAGSIFRVTPTGVFTFLNNSQGGITAPMVVGSDGNLYGTAAGGGNGQGSIFKITPAGKLTVLHSLSADGSEGGNLYAGLVQGTDGYFYGVATGGGTNGYGTIFRVGSKGGSTFSVLYDFDGANGVVGGAVEVSLLQHTNGSFYGLSNAGGTYGSGTFLSWNPSTPLRPFASLVTTLGPVGATIGVLGQGFTATKKVTFPKLVPATYTVVSDTYMTVTVPTGATTGFVMIKTAKGTLKSSKKFTVTP